MRLLLDTNVWEYLSVTNRGDELEHLVKGTQTKVLVAPSVLYETLRISSPIIRARRIELVTREAWTRLMPEAFTEAEEVFGEIVRFRPEWLLARPKTSEFHRYTFDWTRKEYGLWWRARYHPNIEVAALNELGDDRVLDGARKEQKRRRQLNKDRLNTSNVLSQEALVRVDERLVEGWRVAAIGPTANGLVSKHHPYQQWLRTRVDFSKLLTSPALSWRNFWYFDVEKTRMPCHWLRWAFEVLARHHAVTNGTPGDIQLATYLPQADIILSADRNFVSMTNECGRLAPCPMPEAIKVEANSDDVLAHIKELIS